MPLTAGLYAEWEPKAISKLMHTGVYQLCTGEEIALLVPTLCSTADATDAVKTAAQHDTIRSMIVEDQLQQIVSKTTPKEVWDTLKEKHKDTTSRLAAMMMMMMMMMMNSIWLLLAAYYIKIGILEKKYLKDENMHTHLSFIQMENHKLPSETLLIALLQSITNTNKLKTLDVVTHLMQEYWCITRAKAQANSALHTKNKEKSFKSSKKPRCRYCK
ncbi:hypothetical protein B0H17DRAFT_1215241 [Mycena rosella]|uniref:Uncharacterized protein n=1 Tax=Mycena rosella TaxID=1033263 RepID=A0AAD7CLB8_MYCRO|nr:hypothetical protein B0H17DRAFT_1215241 [Mycena rosella]